MVVTFFEKPGCATNAKQKQTLLQAGCMLFEKDLLNNGLDKNELREFFEGIQPSEWFNQNAPKIKKKQIDVASLDENEILDLFMQEPILIKRPLLIVNGEKMCGFNQTRIEQALNRKLNSTVSERCSAKN